MYWLVSLPKLNLLGTHFEEWPSNWAPPDGPFLAVSKTTLRSISDLLKSYPSAIFQDNSHSGTNNAALDQKAIREQGDKNTEHILRISHPIKTAQNMVCMRDFCETSPSGFLSRRTDEKQWQWQRPGLVRSGLDCCCCSPVMLHT